MTSAASNAVKRIHVAQLNCPSELPDSVVADLLGAPDDGFQTMFASEDVKRVDMKTYLQKICDPTSIPSDGTRAEKKESEEAAEAQLVTIDALDDDMGVAHNVVCSSEENDSDVFEIPAPQSTSVLKHKAKQRVTAAAAAAAKARPKTPAPVRRRKKTALSKALQVPAPPPVQARVSESAQNGKSTPKPKAKAKPKAKPKPKPKAKPNKPQRRRKKTPTIAEPVSAPTLANRRRDLEDI